MKHLGEGPNGLNGVARRLYLAAALVATIGWTACSQADEAGSPDTKTAKPEDLQEVRIVAYRITRGSVGSLVDAPDREAAEPVGGQEFRGVPRQARAPMSGPPPPRPPLSSLDSAGKNLPAVWSSLPNGPKPRVSTASE